VDDKLKRIEHQNPSEGTVLTSKAHVVLYSRPGCHLCEEAKATIEAVRRGDEFTLDEVNIESHPELLSRYQYDIPVIAINGVETFMHRVDPEEFREVIGRRSTQIGTDKS
jgi:glutaredoxin